MRPLSLSLLAISACANAQVVFQSIYEGPTGMAAGNAVVQTADGGYAVAGVTSGNGIFDGLLVRYNSTGDTLWSRTYDFGGYDFLTSAVEMADGGFMLGGYRAHEGPLLMRTDADGDTLWTRRYAGASGWQQGSGLCKLPNGWFVLTGETSMDETTPSDMLRLVVDEDGDLISSSTEGGPWRESAHDVTQTANGGLVIVGEQRLHEEDSLDMAFWLFDSQLQAIGNMGYGFPEAEDVPDNITAVAYAVEPCQSGGFIVAGMVTDSITGDTDAVFIRVAQNWEFLWTVILGDAGVDKGTGVVECADGNFSLLWTSSAGNFGTWKLTVVDPNGMQLYSNGFGNADDHTSGNGIAVSLDGNPAVTGQFIDGGSGVGTPEMHLTKIIGACSPVGQVEPDKSVDDAMEVRPNPFASSVALSLPGSAAPVAVRIIDLVGHLLLSAKLSSTGAFIWDGRNSSGTEVPPGVYLVTVTSDEGKRNAQRVIKQ